MSRIDDGGGSPGVFSRYSPVQPAGHRAGSSAEQEAALSKIQAPRLAPERTQNEQGVQNQGPLNEKYVERGLIDIIEKANNSIMGPETMFKFSIHEGTKQIMVKVINKETEETIREIPPEKILNLVAKIWEIAGIIVDERV
ncbi:MAG: flagellar protein FlaG [Bacillota bacterium]